MNQDVVLAIVSTVGVIFTGSFGKMLLTKWWANQQKKLQMSGDVVKEGQRVEGEKRKLLASDNEQRAQMLHDMLDQRDKELKEIQNRELKLREDMSDVKAQMARLEERSSAQAIQIEALQRDASRWGGEYKKMEAERDAYRVEKHDLSNQLTHALLRAERAEGKLETTQLEVDRLRTQIETLLSTANRMEHLP